MEQSKDISELEGHQILARRESSEKAPIFRLPAEILVQIFHFAQYKRRGLDASTKSIHGFTQAWPRLMLVCHRFRIIAVHAPVVWNILRSTFKKQWEQFCLDRSQGMLLRLDDGLDFVAHFHQAQSIDVRDPK